MKTGLWLVIIMLIAVSSFAGGYVVSSRTGTEPGYFAAVEAAGYGGGSEKIEGISDEMMEYYKSLKQLSE